MSSHNRLRGYESLEMAIIATGAAGLVAAGIVCAGPASADQNQDNQYIATLTNAGIPASYATRGMNWDTSVAIKNARATCDNLAHGSTFNAEAADLGKYNPQLTPGQVATETSVAISVYCPQYR